MTLIVVVALLAFTIVAGSLAIVRARKILRAHAEELASRRTPTPSAYTGPIYNAHGNEIANPGNPRRII